MKLHILSIAYPFACVGPDSVGGAEQILHHLDSYLHNSGNHSIVIASEGSKICGDFYPIPRLQGRLENEKKEFIYQTIKIKIEEVLTRNQVDVIHMHGIDFLRYLPDVGISVLVTLHLPLAWYPSEIFDLNRSDLYFNCVSTNQKNLGLFKDVSLPVIDNGISLEGFTGRFEKRDYTISLGRICPEKGFHHALDAARKADINFVLAGKVYSYPDHETYFQEEIQPRLDSRRLFIGPIGLRSKRQILSEARCLLIPSLVPETSSLVAMEALACGTPVIAFATGALTEIVEHGKTGFLVNNLNEMSAAIKNINQIDSEICRKTAWENFSAGQMTDRYFQTYRQLALENQLRTENANVHV
jgi:glycosyltransferase involved in cell wall biosynthesis